MSDKAELYTQIVTLEKITKVTKESKAGNSYDALVLQFRTSKGELKESTVLHTKKDGSLNQKGEALKALASKVKNGVKVTLTRDKNSYHNITKIEEGEHMKDYGNSTASKGGKSNDAQPSIVFQNSMAHATAISIHNAGTDKVDVNDVLELAKTIASVAINPTLNTSVQTTTDDIFGDSEATDDGITTDVDYDDDVPF